MTNGVHPIYVFMKGEIFGQIDTKEPSTHDRMHNIYVDEHMNACLQTMGLEDRNTLACLMR